jgi:hypothetical protein
MTDAADWTEANDRLFFAQTNDEGVLDPAEDTDLASVFKDHGYERTFLIYTSAPLQYPEIGAFAVLATTSFRGTATLKTLKFKDIRLASVEAITSAQLGAIQDKNCNVFLETAGIRMIYDGITPGGEWIDVIHGADALAEQIRVNVFGALSRTSTKIPYTEKGMDALKYEVEQALMQFTDNGFLAPAVDDEGSYIPAYVITSKPVADAPLADKTARIAPDIEFTARLASAIHAITINGKLIL